MRRIVFVRSSRLEYWGCSDCAWEFKPTGPPEGQSIEEMKRNYERHRDQDFLVHVCAQHPRKKKA